MVKKTVLNFGRDRGNFVHSLIYTTLISLLFSLFMRPVEALPTVGFHDYLQAMNIPKPSPMQIHYKQNYTESVANDFYIGVAESSPRNSTIIEFRLGALGLEGYVISAHIKMKLDCDWLASRSRDAVDVVLMGAGSDDNSTSHVIKSIPYDCSSNSREDSSYETVSASRRPIIHVSVDATVHVLEQLLDNADNARVRLQLVSRRSGSIMAVPRVRPAIIVTVRRPVDVQAMGGEHLHQGSSHGRSKRNANAKPKAQSAHHKHRHGRARRRHDLNGPTRQNLCRRLPLYVDFNELDWQDWIIGPHGFQAYYCQGVCQYPFNQHHNSTNHAVVQGLVNSVNPNAAPEPCCVPTSMSPVSLLYMDTNNQVALKEYPDMIVEGCGCR